MTPLNRIALSAAVAASALLVCGSPRTYAQGADAVDSFHPGTGQSSGQESPYYPNNVLGLPDTNARRFAASADPGQILSLGRGGAIVLRFDRAPIVDGAGPDFTVFENAFTYTIGGRERVYAEPGEVAVSRDGLSFIAFPCDVTTLAGCAGVTPTNGEASPFDPQVSGGDAFDLADLAVDSVRFVRITDITSLVADNPSHPFWDPTLTGFDLDAIVAIPLELRGVLSISANSGIDGVTVSPNPARECARISAPPGSLVTVHDAIGGLVESVRIDDGDALFNCGTLTPGTYLIVVRTPGGARFVERLVVVR